MLLTGLADFAMLITMGLLAFGVAILYQSAAAVSQPVGLPAVGACLLDDVVFGLLRWLSHGPQSIDWDLIYEFGGGNILVLQDPTEHHPRFGAFGKLPEPTLAPILLYFPGEPLPGLLPANLHPVSFLWPIVPRHLDLLQVDFRHCLRWLLI